MSAIQSTVDASETAAYLGKVEMAFPGTVIDSYVNGESSAEIPFGRMVCQDTGVNECDLSAAQSDVPIGIAVHSHAYAKTSELGDTGIKIDCPVGVLRRGRIWVYTADQAGPDLAVRYRATASGSGSGTFMVADPTGTDTTVISTFARWISTRADAGLALLEIDMSNAASRTQDS